MVRLCAIALALCLIGGGPASAEDAPFKIPDSDRAAFFEAAEGLADCAGAWEAASSLFTLLPNASSAAHEQANGFEMAGAWLLHSMRIIEDWQYAQKFTYERMQTEMRRWLALFEVSDNQRHTSDMFVAAIEDCKKDLGELQRTLAQELRRESYSLPNNK